MAAHVPSTRTVSLGSAAHAASSGLLHHHPPSHPTPLSIPLAATSAIKAHGAGAALAGGWFYKRRKGLVNIPGWRRRYLVLTTAGRLHYFKSDTATKPRGVLDLRYAFDLRRADACDALAEWPERPIGCRLQLDADDRATMYLVAPSLSMATRWYKLLSTFHAYAVTPSVRDVFESSGQWTSIAESIDNKKDRRSRAMRGGSEPCALSPFLRLMMLARVEYNDRCFDCHVEGTSWVCCQLGVFLCMRCAGLHRQLARDNEAMLCDVRSLELGTFTEEELLELELRGGNRRSAQLYEAELPLGLRRPAETNERMVRFMEIKYIERAFEPIMLDGLPPRRSLSGGNAVHAPMASADSPSPRKTPSVPPPASPHTDDDSQSDDGGIA
eukprot:m.206123 g.206123  ORF g.206123 m.206123 type:complete len:384 (-) comp23217_c0_seq1:43-1194(-)